MQHLARIATVAFALGLILQPLVVGAQVFPGECCCTLDGGCESACCVAEPEPVDACASHCGLCDLGEPGEDEPQDEPQDEPKSPSDRDGCECPMSCCKTIVKVDMGVVARFAPGLGGVSGGAGVVEPEGVVGDAHTGRLKRPPRVFPRA